MSRALLSLLIAFCLTQGYRGNPVEETKPCDDADTCETLEEAKNAAYESLKTAVRAQTAALLEVRNEAAKVQDKMSEDLSEIDTKLVREWMITFQLGNEAFEKALIQGEGVATFECIADCELAARKNFPQGAAKCRSILNSAAEQFKKKIDQTLQQVAAVQSQLNETQEKYTKAIKGAITKISVNWNRDQALKAIAGIGENAKKLSQEFSGIGNAYEKEAQVAHSNCEKELVQITSTAGNCMKGCFPY